MTYVEGEGVEGGGALTLTGMAIVYVHYMLFGVV